MLQFCREYYNNFTFYMWILSRIFCRIKSVSRITVKGIGVKNIEIDRENYTQLYKLYAMDHSNTFSSNIYYDKNAKKSQNSRI